LGLVKDRIRGAPLYEPRDYPERLVARLDLNENPGPVPGFVVEAVAEEARRANRYPEKRLYDTLYELLEDYTGVDRNFLVFGPGSDSLLRAVFDAVVEPGDRVVYPSPGFAMYSVYAALSGAKAELVELSPCGDKWCLDLAELIDRARDAQLVVIDNPNNPTGALLLGRRDIVDLVEETEAVIVIDEAYYEFSGETVIDLVEEHERLVVARTFSKAFGLAGLRIGYMAASRELREAVWKLLAPFPVPRTSLAAAIAALKHRGIVEKQVREIRGNRDWLRGELLGMGIQAYRSWTNFLLADTGIPGVVNKLAEKGVMVRRVPMGDTWMRVTIGTRKELEALLKSLRQAKEQVVAKNKCFSRHRDENTHKP